MIVIKNLQKVISNQTLVDIPELTIANGEVTALIQSPGNESDALVALLIGKTRPTLGTVRVDQIDPAQEREAFSVQVGYVLLWAFAILLAVIWQIRRQGQEAEVSLPQKIRQALPRNKHSASMPASMQPPAPRIAAQPKSVGDAEMVSLNPAARADLAEAKPAHGWQIILAIAVKDMRDMIRNKLVISLLIGTAMLALSKALLPRLVRGA
jgi:hypothetical protein